MGSAQLCDEASKSSWLHAVLLFEIRPFSSSAYLRTSDLRSQDREDCVSMVSAISDHMIYAHVAHSHSVYMISQD